MNTKSVNKILAEVEAQSMKTLYKKFKGTLTKSTVPGATHEIVERSYKLTYGVYKAALSLLDLFLRTYQKLDYNAVKETLDKTGKIFTKAEHDTLVTELHEKMRAISKDTGINMFINGYALTMIVSAMAAIEISESEKELHIAATIAFVKLDVETMEAGRSGGLYVNIADAILDFIHYPNDVISKVHYAIYLIIYAFVRPVSGRIRAFESNPFLGRAYYLLEHKDIDFSLLPSSPERDLFCMIDLSYKICEMLMTVDDINNSYTDCQPKEVKDIFTLYKKRGVSPAAAFAEMEENAYYTYIAILKMLGQYTKEQKLLEAIFGFEEIEKRMEGAKRLIKAYPKSIQDMSIEDRLKKMIFQQIIP